MKSRSSARGVSLVELLTVVAIVGLMVAISIPSLHDLSRRRELQAATAELRTILRKVRSRAVARGSNSGVKFREIGGVWHYGFVDDGDGDGVMNDDIVSGVDRIVTPFRQVFGTTGKVRIGLPDVPVRDGESGDIVTPDSSPVRFNRSTICSFSSTGSATPGSIYLTDGARGAAAVVVYGATGKVRMKMLADVGGAAR